MLCTELRDWPEGGATDTTQGFISNQKVIRKQENKRFKPHLSKRSAAVVKCPDIQ